MPAKKTILLIVVLIMIVGGIFYLESKKVGGSGEVTSDIINSMDETEKAKKYPRAKEIDPDYGFINSDGITVEELIGKKVILLDIWTYSCINCQRTLPYITGWYEKYKDQGLEIIGVHTPEFEFEKDYENVLAATKQFGVTYPVVLDNDYKTWNAYGNRYWPRKYIIDIDGFVVYDHIGEGAYAETEKVIQELLKERKERLGEDILVSEDILTPSDAERVDRTKPRSPEVYFGAWRNNSLGNGATKTKGVQIFEEPEGIKTHIQYFEGEWDIKQEYAENVGVGKIIFRYQGGKVFMVASSVEGVSMKVLVDGEEVGARAGSDVDENGEVYIQNEQLYRLIEDPDGWGEHTLELIPQGPGLQAFTFTFG